jgi:peptidoglycan L-alanyl-D-glutamate endopeptidase CwlK
MSNFRWGLRSLQNLSGIHHDLRRVADRALQLTTQDMTVIEGIRSIERQRQLLAQGHTRTLNSRHITGMAIDLVPAPFTTWEDTDRWDTMATAFAQASRELEIPCFWGCAWHKPIGEFKTGKEAREDYVATRRKQRRSVFLDFPHIELCRTTYPG